MVSCEWQLVGSWVGNAIEMSEICVTLSDPWRWRCHGIQAPSICSPQPGMFQIGLIKAIRGKALSYSSNTYCSGS